MSIVLRFKTRLFDVATERANPINPIPGESLLLWLGKQLAPDHPLSAPEPEDWGWYSSLVWDGRAYLVGSCAYDADENGEREWVLQVDKSRSFGEKLLGRAKMASDDPCVARLRVLLEGEPAFTDVAAD